MASRIPRGAPAKYAHHGVTEKIQFETNRISCSKCQKYNHADKTCMKYKYFIPEIGYDRWKYCPNMKLIESATTPSALAYLKKVQAAVTKSTESLGVKVHRKQKYTYETARILTIMNITDKKVLTYYVVDDETTALKEDQLLRNSTLYNQIVNNKDKKIFKIDKKEFRVIDITR